MPIITLTSDFGTRDGFSGVLKGVIWSICPAAQIADFSHEIPPHNVLQGARVLQRAWHYFPSGTVHLAVIDPGVGTSRRPLAIGLAGHYFVGPDNGLFNPILQEAESRGLQSTVIELVNQRYFLDELSSTFHGRDIFAPVAAHLANGVRLEDFGARICDMVHLELPQPRATSHGWVAHITGMDVFGNCTTDLKVELLRGCSETILRVGGVVIHGLESTYGNKKSAEFIALADSEGWLEIALVNGSAANQLHASVGDEVEIECGEATS
jgi:hypothetical protein